MGPGDLKEILQYLPAIANSRILVGLESADDAGVVLINDETALVQTVDYITPVCDDPYLFGQIAAANALSDIYAMGAKPYTALNLCNFPAKLVSRDSLAKILLGSLDKLIESSTMLIGGHTIKDEELKYGLAITGLVHPQKIVKNSGAQIGDVLILTKPLGTGVAIELYKKKELPAEEFQKILEVMSRLNKIASEFMLKYEAHACTDITGFGFAGHASVVARQSNLSIEIDHYKLPVYPAALDWFKKGEKAGASKANKTEYEPKCSLEKTIPDYMKEIMFDPQTSGGLLISVAAPKAPHLLADLLANGEIAAAVGRVVAREDADIIVK